MQQGFYIYRNNIYYGFYADIHAGAIDESHLEAFGTYLGQITWQ